MGTLVPVEQKEIEFYGDNLTAVRANDGHVYVTLRHMCDALGIDAQGQSRRINRHMVMAKGMTWVDILSTQGTRQRRRVRMLRVDLVPLWLSGIRTSMVKEEMREKLERFQEQAAKVLWEAFQDGRLTTDPAFDELLQSESEAVQAYKMLQALVKLARNQIIIESRLDDHDQRLETIEATLGDPKRHVTPDQASQISQGVKAVAIALGKQTKRNEFGAVYGELYRKFGVTSYKMLPVEKFDTAMKWLSDWYQSIEGDAPF